MRLLTLAASLRRESLNKRLMTLAERDAAAAGAELDHAEFREFEMPLYDGDLQEASGFPAGALELARRIAAADGIMLASPEYNYSLPGNLKNAIDWVSRMRPMPFRGKTALLLTASPSLVGGIRGLWQLRIPLEGLGVFVHPDMYALASADRAFDAQGELRDPASGSRLTSLVNRFVKYASALASVES